MPSIQRYRFVPKKEVQSCMTFAHRDQLSDVGTLITHSNTNWQTLCSSSKVATNLSHLQSINRTAKPLASAENTHSER